MKFISIVSLPITIGKYEIVDSSISGYKLTYPSYNVLPNIITKDLADNVDGSDKKTYLEDFIKVFDGTHILNTSKGRNSMVLKDTAVGYFSHKKAHTNQTFEIVRNADTTKTDIRVIYYHD